MAPIPVYTDSPIAAAKASGVTPQTAPPSSTSKPTPTSSLPTSSSQAYPSAQPGAVPSLPATTADASRARVSSQPIQTANHDGPPAPQPGAVPVPTGVAKPNIPPPPKAGEKLMSIPYPQQMAIPPPTAPNQSQQRGTSTAPVPTSEYSPQGSAALSGPPVHHSLEHPPGYHQNSNASELGNYQRSAFQRSEVEDQTGSSESGVWEAAKKWAHQTGEKIAAAETEVWKKINKE
ncbi:hypothetical protein F4815DRAFT_20632 [Daldinia loculata]|uniref:uncharacterized protein n=1 Tax=Daldinia loculata TaxID=103429 RepID=UPI0020C3E771|nr:uncharacterized protein F4817DRAFT_346427 [Daldinia loculata]KAI1644515.1 hypothetical protein F4817DRAFT_346427 [Daldinia loculata]KAI2785412.1 hypothetical protein F4815DRAFT_20632 [Daldinia loculata]